MKLSASTGTVSSDAVCTWGALEAALFGMGGSSWLAVGARLKSEGYVSDDVRDDIALLWHFGRLIANSDMHEGNLAFLLGRQGEPLALAPVYDMLPMLYAPMRGGELPTRSFAPALPLPEERDAWRRAAQCAVTFWSSASADARISDAFYAVCAANRTVVRRLITQV